MDNSKINWHNRFADQLKWTQQLRSYLYHKIEMEKKRRVLDIGCGTGLMLAEIGTQYELDLYGIDIDKERLSIAESYLKHNNVSATILHMDFLENDFQGEVFDVIITNFFFLWVNNLEKSIQEIHRILGSKGILLIFGEPDYGGMIEYPNTHLKKALFSNLMKNGADPEVGRKISHYFPGRFKVIEHYCNSIPWISLKNKEGLLRENDFFKKILIDEQWDSNLMKENIEREDYLIFVPVFSYYLEKLD